MLVRGHRCLVVLYGGNLELLSFDKGFRDFAVPFKHGLQTIGYLLLSRFHLLIGGKSFVSVFLISVPLFREFLEVGLDLLEKLPVFGVRHGLGIELSQVRHDHRIRHLAFIVKRSSKSTLIFVHTPDIILNDGGLSILILLILDIYIDHVLDLRVDFLQEPLCLHLFDVVGLGYAHHRVSLLISVREVPLWVKINTLFAIGYKLVHAFEDFLLKVSSRVGAQSFNDECLLFVYYANV